MKYKFMAIMLLFLLLSSCNSSGGSILKDEPTETPFPTSTATPVPMNTPLPAPTEQPSPVVPVVASVQRTDLTESGLVFSVVSKTLGLDLHTAGCTTESIKHGYITYTIDGSLCFYIGFDINNFPINNPKQQSGMYMLIVEKGDSPYSEGVWSIVILNSAYLSDEVKMQLKEFDEGGINSIEKALLINEIIQLPKGLEDWVIADIYPLSNEQVDLLYSSDLITIER